MAGFRDPRPGMGSGDENPQRLNSRLVTESPEVFERLLALNNAHAKELSWLDEEKLATLIRSAFLARRIGFLLASIFITLVAQRVGHAQFGHAATTDLVTPIKNLRTWAFAFGFLSIGLTTRVSDLARVGVRPLLAFSSGVVVNVGLGFVLSVLVFGGYWAHLGQ